MAAAGALGGGDVRKVPNEDLPFWDYDKAVEDLDIGENARAQEARWRKDPIRPFIDTRTESPEYNPIVDDWVDVNNPRWKALKRHFAKRSGPFFIGTCISTKNPKTAMIAVPYWKRWLKLGKYVAIKRTTKIMAHDPDQLVEVGDVVEIRHSRPYSKRKHFIVKRILQKEPGNAFVQAHPEFAVTRSRADLKKHVEQMRLQELKEHAVKRAEDRGKQQAKKDEEEGEDEEEEEEEEEEVVKKGARRAKQAA